MLSKVNAWRIAELKVNIWQKMFSEWIDFSHKDTIYKIWQVKHRGFAKFSKLSCCQTFLLYGMSVGYYYHRFKC